MAGWSPSSRRNGQRELARAVLELVHDDAPTLTSGERKDADGYLRRIALMYPRPDDVDESDAAWEQWFLQWSLPLGDITDDHLQAFLTRVRTHAVDGLSAPSVRAVCSASVRPSAERSPTP